ncbi:MAG: CAP domain-containing protein [Nitrosarchaeum sp.]|nr:CAP domain-containing protein [Nitrosarchaeum sp.]
MGFCRHNYVYSQGSFFCIKCRKRTYGKQYKRNQAKKISAGIMIVLVIGFTGFLFVNGVFEINTNNLDKSIQNIPKNIQETTKTVKNVATDTSDTIQKTLTDQIDTLQKTSETIPETKIPKITVPQVELPEYEKPKEYILAELKQIALDDINKYRKEKGIHSILLGNAKASQLYSSELLAEGCIHHISNKGEGPMLRYQNNRDTMFLVSENIAGGSGTIWMSPQDSILDANKRMMFDDADSNWGHRNNILDSGHHSVSIGIAYDDQRLVMVQDFEQVLVMGYNYEPRSFEPQSVDQKSCW